MRRKVISPCLFGATDWTRTNDLRFTKPLQAASQGSRASIFERLKLIDLEIETLRQERQSLIAQLEVLALKKDEE